MTTLAPKRMHQRHSSANLSRMPSIQVKNVPDDVHGILRVRAARAGQSMQEYLLELLSTAAREPTLDEVLARAASRSGGRAPLAETTALIRQERDSRS